MALLQHISENKRSYLPVNVEVRMYLTWNVRIHTEIESAQNKKAPQGK